MRRRRRRTTPAPQSRAPRRAAYLQVDLERVRLSLSERPILRGIDWRIAPRERWVLMGANGAGKTQLMKLLAADVWPTGARGGVRRYHWRGDSHTDPYDIKSEIAYVGAERQDRYEHYEWNHRVEAVIGTGLYRTDIPLDRLTTADRAQIGALLQRLGIQPLVRRRFLTLSYGERRLVLLARALAARPALLLLDELFNGLDTRNRERALQCLRSLSRSGLPWVLSTHRAEDIPSSATHLCVLERGRIVAHGRLSARLRGIGALLTTPAHMVAGRRARRRVARSSAEAPVLLSLHAADVWRGGARVLAQLSLQIRRGDAWVVHGANGSGKSSFIQLLYGDLGVASGGRIERAGLESGMPIALFKQRVGLITGELQAMHPLYLSALEVVASGLHSSVGLNQLPSARERERALQALRRVGAAGLATRALRALSYGQLRRVLYARALIRAPDILLLDEPYTGLDAATRRSLYAQVEQIVESGVTVVIATHHRDEWPQHAAYELELEHGRVRYCGAVRTRTPTPHA